MKSYLSVLSTLGVPNKAYRTIRNLSVATGICVVRFIIICITFVNNSKENLLFLKGLGRQVWFAALWEPVKSGHADRHF